MKFVIEYNEKTGELGDFIQVKSARGGGSHKASQRKLIKAFCRKHEGNTSFLTFGCRKTESSIKKFSETVKEFLRIAGQFTLQDYDGEKFPEYICIIELGERGGRVHIHLLVPGLFEFKKSYIKANGKESQYLTTEGKEWLERWEKFIKEENTHIYSVELKYQGETEEISLEKIAGYIAKYMTKKSLLGVRTFRSSKNLKLRLKDYFTEEEKKPVYFLERIYQDGNGLEKAS